MSFELVKRMEHGEVVTRRYQTTVVRKEHFCQDCHNVIKPRSFAWTFRHELWVHGGCFTRFKNRHARTVRKLTKETA